nr:hypothetical protein [Candidatus Sigynarchaeota archaeon]
MVRAGRANFTAMSFTRDPVQPDDAQPGTSVQGRDIETLPVGLLQPRRLSRQEDLSFSIPSNNGYMRARLEQIVEPTRDLLSLQDAIEKHVHEIRKHPLNPRVKEE